MREASLCVRLAHPAIVQVRALLEDEGFAAIVFDYIEGIALAKLMKLCASRGVRLPDNVAWHIVERVLSALAYAHKQTDESHEPAPIVHRDVSPSNVLIAWSGDVKLTDFGIAKMLGVSPATQYGLVKGTLGCMAPEQARGEPVDERADVYAAGLLAWRLATGRNPYAQHDKDEIELLRAMRNPRLKPLSALRPDLPGPLSLAVGRALSPQAADRNITAEELAAVVRGSLDVEMGQLELQDLLGRFRPVLEKKRAREGALPGSPPGSGPTLDSVSSTSGDQKNPTRRYDEVAQDDYDDVAFDGPTVQFQALPGDAASWASRPTPDPLSARGAAPALPRVVESAPPPPLVAQKPVPAPPRSGPLLIPTPAPIVKTMPDTDRVSSGPDSLARFRYEVTRRPTWIVPVLATFAAALLFLSFMWWVFGGR